MLHYTPQRVSSSTLLIIRRSNCITTASGIVTLCKQLCSMRVESGLQSALHLHTARLCTELCTKLVFWKVQKNNCVYLYRVEPPHIFQAFPSWVQTNFVLGGHSGYGGAASIVHSSFDRSFCWRIHLCWYSWHVWYGRLGAAVPRKPGRGYQLVHCMTRGGTFCILSDSVQKQTWLK